MLLRPAVALVASVLVSWAVTGVVRRQAMSLLSGGRDGSNADTDEAAGDGETRRSSWRSAGIVGLMFFVDFVWLGAVYWVSSRPMVLLAAATGLLGMRFVLLTRYLLRGARMSS